MLNIFLFVISFSLSLNELVPDKDNAILLNEYDIQCPDYGSPTFKITYKINNYQSKRYFQLIKSTLIHEFYLYEGDIKLFYETNTDYDYFYPITSNNTLYLVINHFSSYCISFKFIDSNYISLTNNEEYKYPVVTSNQIIIAKVKNVANKHFIFYLKHTNSNKDAGYSIEFNGTSYNKYPGTKISSLFPKNNEIEIKIKLAGEKIIATFRYISVPYSNITEDTIKCNNDSNFIQSFIITKSNKNYWYYWYFLSNNKIEYYDDDKLKTELSNINTFNYYTYTYKYFILLKDKGCFQIKYSNYSTTSFIEIKNKDSFLVLNSNYNFMISNSYLSNENYRYISIYSSEKNFINEIKIKNSLQKFIIKNKDNLYFYNFNFTIESSQTIINIDFNLNARNYIIIYFEIEEHPPQEENKDDDDNNSPQEENKNDDDNNLPQKENKNNDDNNTLYYILGTLGGIFLFVFFCFLFPKLRKCYEKNKIKKNEEQTLLDKMKYNDLVKDFYKQVE